MNFLDSFLRRIYAWCIHCWSTWKNLISYQRKKYLGVKLFMRDEIKGKSAKEIPWNRRVNGSRDLLHRNEND